MDMQDIFLYPQPYSFSTTWKTPKEVFYGLIGATES